MLFTSKLPKESTIMNRNNRNPFFSIVAVFIILNALFLTQKNFLVRKGFDQSVLIIGNLILFVITALSLWLTRKSLDSNNPNVFVRSIYKSTMLKLFGCLAAAVVYIFI